MSRGRRAADNPIETTSRPDEPGRGGDGYPSGEKVGGEIGGVPDVPDIPNISAVYRDDDLVAALATRRIAADASEVAAAADDDAIRLLRALVADVDADADAPPLPVVGTRAADGPNAGSKPRRRARAFISLGVVALMLTTTGVAAAGGGGIGVGSRSVVPADDRQYRESRAELRHVREAADRRQYDTPRSLDGPRHRQKGRRGPRASVVDKEIGKLDPWLRHVPSFPRPGRIAPGQTTSGQFPPMQFPTTHKVPKPGELRRQAHTEAESQLDDIRWRPSR